MAPLEVVVDEFAGQWIAMLGLGRVSLYGLIAAFVFGDRGVKAVATGPTDAGAEPSAAVLRMIGSISQSGQEKR